ncbi:MAG: hypothetical protein ACM3VT_05140 [Solirubrobacterales bacterium]
MTRAIFNARILANMVLLLAGLSSGCAGRHPYAKHQFVLEASRPAESAGKKCDVALAVRNFTVDPVCDCRGMLYRKGQAEYESDFYNEFLIAPQILISTQTRNWLARSGRFRTVLEPGSLVEATHILEGNVLALYGDFRGEGVPQAVMQIRVFVVANRNSGAEVVFSRDYQVSHRADERTAESLVTAFNRCLEQMLTDLEKDLGETL